MREYGGIKEAEASGVVYIGRPSVLGNLYSHLSGAKAIKVASREAAIDSYRKWLYRALTSGNQAVIAALERLDESMVLGCWCKPLSCHGDVIVAAWEWWMSRGENNG